MWGSKEVLMDKKKKVELKNKDNEIFTKDFNFKIREDEMKCGGARRC